MRFSHRFVRVGDPDATGVAHVDRFQFLIGLYLRWAGEPLPASLAERFGASLSIGRSGAIDVHDCDGAALASIRPGPARTLPSPPAQTPRGESVLFDGHLLNRSSLHRALGGDSAPPDDATLYARAYAKWGDACDLQAIGEYATIIWSPRDRRVRIATSPVRARPLHIWQEADRLIVASAARAIFATGEVCQELDEQKIADALYLNYREGERSWFKGVRRVMPGHRIRVHPDVTRSTRYYDFSSLPDIRLPRDADYVAAAEALFEEGTRAMLAGYSRPAISLSGGLDSQAVAAYAAQTLPSDQRLLAITAVPQPDWDRRESRQGFGDERHHAEALVAMYPQCDFEAVDAAGLSFDHHLEAMFLLSGAPPRNAMNMPYIHAIHARAAARKCDILLTGTFGNATFSFNGTGALPSLLRRGRWGALLRELSAGKGTDPLGLMFAKQVLAPFLPEPLYRGLMRWRHGARADPLQSWCSLDSAYARDMRVRERAVSMGLDAVVRPPASTRAARIAMFGNAVNEASDILEALDTLHGIPTRDPTAYRPLVEFCLGIPDDQYLRGGEQRWLAKRMLRDRIPAMVLSETRRGVQAADWHLRIGRTRAALRSELERIESDPVMARRFDIAGMKAALDDWPADTPLEGPRLERLRLAIPRGLLTARFINYVEGRNDV